MFSNQAFFNISNSEDSASETRKVSDSDAPEIQTLLCGVQFMCSDPSLSRESVFSSTYDVTPSSTEVPVTRGVLAMPISSMGDSYDTIHGRLDVPATSYVKRNQGFAPAMLASILDSAPRRPPLIPATSFITMFDVASPVEDIVVSIDSLLVDFGDKMTFQFSNFEFIWSCTYLSEGYHVNFHIRIYRYPLCDGKTGTFAVEFQRMEGDRVPYMNVYNACREMLTSTDSFDLATYACEHPFGNFFGLDSDTGDASLDLTSFSESQEQIKDSIVKQLSSHVTYNSLLENVQMVSSLYNSPFEESVPAACVISPSEVDRQLFKVICNVAHQYSTNSKDWVYQHSIIAVADMLDLFDKCTCSSLPAFISSCELSEALVQSLRGMGCLTSSHCDNNSYLVAKSEQIARLISRVSWN